MPIYRTWLEVDLAALRENARTAVASSGGARLLPMVKANAYGLGAVQVAGALEQLDPWGYGVATPEEGAELRGAGIQRPILVFSPLRESLELVAASQLTPALGSAEQVRSWRALSADRPFHVQIDTGMGRGGIWWDGFADAAREFGRDPGFQGVFTHFHSAESNPDSVMQQWSRFTAAVGSLPRRPELVHAANSAAAIGHPETAADMIRPGIFLYGSRAGSWPVRPCPVVALRARVVESCLRDEGATVSYGATFKVRGRMCLATLAAGYADGVHRDLSNRGEVLLAGRRARIAGRVTMDMTVAWCEGWFVDDGAIATLIGRDGGEEITLDEVADRAGTVSHEILTGLGPRVPRIYHDG